MIRTDLLTKFYADMQEHPINTEEPQASWDFKEYEEHMLNIRKAIRFFMELAIKDEQPY